MIFFLHLIPTSALVHQQFQLWASLGPTPQPSLRQIQQMRPMMLVTKSPIGGGLNMQITVEKQDSWHVFINF